LSAHGRGEKEEFFLPVHQSKKADRLMPTCFFGTGKRT